MMSTERRSKRTASVREIAFINSFRLSSIALYWSIDFDFLNNASLHENRAERGNMSDIGRLPKVPPTTFLLQKAP